MASMSRNTSTSSVQGFSVYQPALGTPLQFLPAVGTKELEQLIDAYIPGPASAPEKRASISMDFFEHSGQTGENFKYYAVYSPVATPESAHSSSSSFNVSPVMSDLSFYGSPSQASTPAAAQAAKRARVASQQNPAGKPRQERSDFAHLPGMKILTKDGQDVTNSVSRGCKSKEQRDHAHLMRILKACDACKKKKIRCDPSHKKRSASQVDSECKSEAAKPAKKTKKTAAMPMAESTASKHAPAGGSLMDDLGMTADFSAPLDESWEQFLTFNDEPVAAAVPQDFYSAIPQGFDFFFDVEKNTNFSPSASGSSVSPIQPVTPVGSGIIPQVDDFTVSLDNSLVFLQSEGGNQELALPYLNPGSQHGSNYVDFNLFSPTSSFVDEEPQLLKSGSKTNVSASRHTHSINAPVSSTGLSGDLGWYFDQSRFTVGSGEPEWQVPGGHVSQTRHPAACDGDGDLGLYGGPQPYHPHDSGHDTSRSVDAVTRLQGLQSTRRDAPVVDTTDPRGGNPSGGTVATSAPVLSRAVRAQIESQDIILASTGSAHMISQTVSPTVRSPRPLLAIFETNMLTAEKELNADNAIRLLELRSLRPGHATPTITPALLLVSTSTDVASSSGGHILSQESQQPAGGLQGLDSPLAARSPSQPAEGLSSSCTGSPLALQQRATGSIHVNAALPVHGRRQVEGLLRPAAHNPLRLLEKISGGAPQSTSPVRQLLASTTLVLSRLVASGLVSILMVMMMMVMVVVTSTLSEQAQTQMPILANLPITCVMILLSLLPAAHQRPRAMSAGGALDSARSLFSRGATTATTSTRRCRPTWAGPVARVPLLSCV